MGIFDKAYQAIQSSIKKDGFKRYFKNTSWLFVEKILMLGFSFAVGAVVARYLGPDQLGLLSFAQSLIGFLYIFSALGMESVLTRDLVKSPEKQNQILGSAVYLRILGSLFSWVLIAMVLFFSEETRNSSGLIIVLGTGYIFRIFEVIKSSFEARVESFRLVKIRLVQTLIVGGMKISLILLEAPLIWFAVAILVEYIIIAVWYSQKYNAHVGKLGNWRKETEVARGLIRDSWPFILSTLAIVIYMRSDQLMIKYFLSDEDNGYYSVALKLSEMWYFFPALIIDSLYPAIVNAKKTAEKLYVERMENLFSIMFVGGLGIAVFMTLFGPYILELAYGSEYNPAKDVLVIHIWGILFAYLGSVAGKWLLTENLQRFTFYRTILGAIANVALNLWWIPKYGITGAAAATLVSQIIASYLGHLLSRKTWPLFFMVTRTLLGINLIKNIKTFIK